MIISFNKNRVLKLPDALSGTEVSHFACAFDSDFMVGFEGAIGYTIVFLSSGHKITIPNVSLDIDPIEFRQALQADLIGRANKRLEQVGQAIAHTVAVQQYNRVFGEFAETLRQARENSENEEGDQAL